MAQGILPFKYEIEKNTTGMTALVPIYRDVSGLGPGNRVK